ncbi:unnamed protein product [Lactuca saligna]|uniref:MULE transposase domain-containing protein n=1 Tax=Lactuca saligna TaxID=75948 RepID=A0AA36E5L8_LACSI|nr:unnamed protein product [Lactuca saligna]
MFIAMEYFPPNPLKYLDPKIIIVCDVDFGGFTYKEFLLWLRNLTKGSCNVVYYYSRKETLAKGIIRINSDADYWEFVEATYTPEAELDVHIDHQKEPILYWADNEVLSDGIGNLNDDDEPNDGEDDKDVFPVHDEKQEWDKMVPIIGRDVNNRIYPLAWAVVAVESIETWKWFVDLLLDDIEIRNGHGLKSRS